jgi:rubrerythrin
MVKSYRADEILEMAKEIERRGVVFYQKAAKKAADDQRKKLFLELSSMEQNHLETFTDMFEKLIKGDNQVSIFDPDSEMAHYLQQIAAGKGWEGKASPDSELTGNESAEEILRIAIEAEKASIQFYLGLKESVLTDESKKQVENIIREEMSHVATLDKELAAL